jgi:hypothetical protein
VEIRRDQRGPLSDDDERDDGMAIEQEVARTPRAVHLRASGSGIAPTMGRWQMRRLVRTSIQLFIPAILLFLATTAFALPGDPPLWGGDCSDEAKFHADDPDLPVAVSVVNQLIRNQSLKMYEAKAAPYLEVDPQTGNKVYKRRYQPQIDAISRE